MFSVDTYNRLPYIWDAAGVFANQLKSSNLTMETLLQKLEPLFSKGDDAGKYGIWILHRHFSLQAGERMVETGDTTEPTIADSPCIVAERWNAEGRALEYRYIDPLDVIPSPPSAEFMTRFKAEMDAMRIDSLGVCFAPTQQDIEKIKGGYIFLETTNDDGRKQVINAVLRDHPLVKDQSTFEACWTMSGEVGCRCNHICQAPSCFKKPDPDPEC